MTREDCVFCKIADGEIPSSVIYRDEEMVAFRDIRPEAPTHVLLVPRRHLATLNDASPEDAALLGRLIVRARDLAKREKLSDKGYRLVVNCGPMAGQTVYHLHLHLLGGRHLGWPPG